MDGGAWQATVHGVTRSWTQLIDEAFTTLLWRTHLHSFLLTWVTFHLEQFHRFDHLLESQSMGLTKTKQNKKQCLCYSQGPKICDGESLQRKADGLWADSVVRVSFSSGEGRLHVGCILCRGCDGGRLSLSPPGEQVSPSASPGNFNRKYVAQLTV